MVTNRVGYDTLPRAAGSAAEVEAVPAASVLVLRGKPPEILMVRRHAESSFVPNAWVFPGGAVDPLDRAIAHEIGDGSMLDTMRIAGARETLEETGLWLGDPLARAEELRSALLERSATLRDVLAEAPLDLSRLVWTSRWITPVGFPKRFDAWFFLAPAPDGAIPTAEQREAVDVVWLTAAEALRRHEQGTFRMVFPTVKNLEAIADAPSIEALVESRRHREIQPIQPVLLDDGDWKRIVLP